MWPARCFKNDFTKIVHHSFKMKNYWWLKHAWIQQSRCSWCWRLHIAFTTQAHAWEVVWSTVTPQKTFPMNNHNQVDEWDSPTLQFRSSVCVLQQPSGVRQQSCASISETLVSLESPLRPHPPAPVVRRICAVHLAVLERARGCCLQGRCASQVSDGHAEHKLDKNKTLGNAIITTITREITNNTSTHLRKCTAQSLVRSSYEEKFKRHSHTA